MTIGALDVETATSSAGSICAIGAAVIEGGRVVRSRAWLVRPPGNRFDWFNVRVHGIQPEDTREAPDFGAVWPEVVRFLGATDFVVAHNAAAVERRHLRSALERAALRPPRWRLACTLRASRTLRPRLPRHGLAELAAGFDIPLDHHDPESDAAACALVAIKLGTTRRLAEFAVDWA